MTLPAAWTIADSLDEAFERCGVAPSGITEEHIDSAARSIRLLLSSWNNDSIDFWKVSSGNQQTLAVDDDSFTPVSGTLDIIRAKVLRDDVTTPMLIIGAEDWFRIPDLLAGNTGMPNRLWVERLASSVTANFWPASENATDKIVYDAILQFNDSTVLSGSADVPETWLTAFLDGLTMFLSQKFDRANYDRNARIYGGPMIPTGSYAVARAGNREKADTVFVVHNSRRRRR